MRTIVITSSVAICKFSHFNFLLQNHLFHAIGTKLGRNILMMDFTKFEDLALIENLRWLLRPIMCSDWLKFQRSSQKPEGTFGNDIAGKCI